MLRRSSTILLLVLLTSASLCPCEGRGEAAAPRAVDLLADRDAWSSWAARPELAPRFAAEPGSGPDGRSILGLSGGGNEEVCGCWRRPLPRLLKGRRYRVEAAFQ